MKTITVSIDLKSFFLGVFSLGGMLMLVNFTPANEAITAPVDEVGRYQAVTHQDRTLILDTKTGAYMFDRGVGSKLRWLKSEFNATSSDTGK